MENKRRTVLELGVGLGFLLSVVLTLWFAGRAQVAAQVRADTVRLHVLANSDTLEDQLIKLQVRDAILAALPAAVTEAGDPGPNTELSRFLASSSTSLAVVVLPTPGGPYRIRCCG